MENIYLNADKRLSLHNCPRCGEQGYEKLRTHSHCVSCNYFDAPEAYSYKTQALRCDQILKDIEETKLTKHQPTTKPFETDEDHHDHDSAA